eukprot:754429-Hanusia_phi.AAC.1
MEERFNAIEPSWAREPAYSDRKYSNANFPMASRLRSELLMEKEKVLETPDVMFKPRQAPPSPAESMKEALDAIKRYGVISDMGKMQDSLLKIIEEQVRLRMKNQVWCERVHTEGLKCIQNRANRENVIEFATVDGTLLREYQIQKEELFSEISRLQMEIMQLKEKNYRLKAENEQAYNLVKTAKASEATLQHVLQERQISLDLLKNAKSETERQSKEQADTAKYELQAKIAVREIEQAKNAVSEAVLQVNTAPFFPCLTGTQAKKYKSMLEQETTEKERLQASRTADPVMKND